MFQKTGYFSKFMSWNRLYFHFFISYGTDCFHKYLELLQYYGSTMVIDYGLLTTDLIVLVVFFEI